MGFFGGGNDQTKTTTAPWKPARQPLRDIISDYGDLRQNAFSYFPDQTYADFDPRQLQGMEGLYGYTGAGVRDPAMQAYNFALQSPDVANNPYVNAMMDRNRANVTRAFAEDWMPHVNINALGAGGFGGSGMSKAAGREIGRAADALADANVQTQLGAYGQGMQAQQGALGQATNMYNMGLNPYMNQIQVGGMYQAQDQRGIDEAMARHDFGQNEPWQRLGMYSDAIRGIGSMGGTSTQETPRSSTFDKLLATGTTLGAAYLGAGGSLPWGGGAGGAGGGYVPTSPTAANRFNMGVSAFQG